MAVRIRLRRMGAKKQPSYRVVVADSRKASDGRFIEVIGHYNPRREPPEVVIKEDRALWWLSCGAQPSDTARALLRQAGILQRFDEWQREQSRSRAESRPAQSGWVGRTQEAGGPGRERYTSPSGASS